MNVPSMPEPPLRNRGGGASWGALRSQSYPPQPPVSTLVCDFLDRLPDVLRGQASPLRAIAGKILFSDSLEAGKVFHVIQGAVSLKRSFSGEETIIQLATDGDWLVEPDPITPDAGAWAVCESDSLLVSLPIGEFGASLEIESGFALAWRRELLRQLMQMRRHRLRLIRTSVEQRIIHYLMTESPGGRGEMGLPYSIAVWAGQLGVVPETLSRALSKMEGEGKLKRLPGKRFRLLRPFTEK